MLQPLRLLNAYGAFEPYISPPYCHIWVMEGSANVDLDAAEWIEYKLPFSTLWWTGPHCPRFTGQFYHERWGNFGEEVNFMNPFYYGAATSIERLCVRLL